MKFGRAFEMCDQECQNFLWFVKVLRIYLSTIDGPLNLLYFQKFWVHFSRVVVEEPMVMTYYLYMSFLHMRVFSRFFHIARVFPREVDCHFFAPGTDTCLGYRVLG